MERFGFSRIGIKPNAVESGLLTTPYGDSKVVSRASESNPMRLKPVFSLPPMGIKVRISRIRIKPNAIEAGLLTTPYGDQSSYLAHQNKTQCD
jgi:hypothetical protein